MTDLLRAAREMQESGDEDGAVTIYEEALARQPRHAAALHALGVAMTRRSEFRRAVSLLEKAVAIRPSNPVYHVDLAEAYRNVGDYGEAIGCCRTALKLRPEYPEALNTFGLALLGPGDRDGALECFRRALAVQPAFSPAHTNAGRVLQELGRIEEAIAHFRAAVACAPKSPLAQTNLGLALLGQERATESIPHFEAAARLEPGSAVAHHNLGNALRLVGRFDDARSSYLKAIRVDDKMAISYFHLGATLRHEGLFGEALKWYTLAAEMEPGNIQFWKELADLHLKREEPDKAVECRRRVVELTPVGNIEARIDLGWALQEDGRQAEALELYRTLQQLWPNSPQVHFAASGVHEEAGDFAAAEDSLRVALRAQPRFPVAHARLATLLRGRLPEHDVEAIEQLLLEPDLNRHQRDRLLFGLAHVLDARAEYSWAAACLAEANASTLQWRRMEGAIYEPDHHERFVDAFLDAFNPDFFRRTAGIGLTTARPVFVVGLPRSGTTLVEKILASHPRVHGAGERLFGRKSFEMLPPIVDEGLPPLACIELIDEYAIKRIAGEHLAKLNALDLGRAERIVDKLPDNYLYMGLLAAMFPNAVFIHCRRDLRDTAVSCWISDFRSVRWANDAAQIAGRFHQYRRLMEHWGRVLPAPILEIQYEDTVADVESVARRLVDACQLDWDPVCLEFHRTQRVVRTASLTQVRRPIYTSSVGRWRNYERELAELYALLPQDDDSPMRQESNCR